MKSWLFPLHARNAAVPLTLPVPSVQDQGTPTQPYLHLVCSLGTLATFSAAPKCPLMPLRSQWVKSTSLSMRETLNGIAYGQCLSFLSYWEYLLLSAWNTLVSALPWNFSSSVKNWFHFVSVNSSPRSFYFIVLSPVRTFSWNTCHCIVL